MTGYEPTTWLGLLGLLLLVSGPIVTTVLAARRGQRKADQHASTVSNRVKGIEDQVINSHDPENHPVLRDDLDRVMRTGEQTYELLLDTHKMVTDHNGHITQIRDQVSSHSQHIRKIHEDLGHLTGRMKHIDEELP